MCGTTTPSAPQSSAFSHSCGAPLAAAMPMPPDLIQRVQASRTICTGLCRASRRRAGSDGHLQQRFPMTSIRRDRFRRGSSAPTVTARGPPEIHKHRIAWPFLSNYETENGEVVGPDSGVSLKTNWCAMPDVPEAGSPLVMLVDDKVLIRLVPAETHAMPVFGSSRRAAPTTRLRCWQPTSPMS